MRTYSVLRTFTRPAGFPRNAGLVALGIAVLGVLWYVLAQLLPVGADFYWWYYRIPQEWWAGNTRLYDENSRQFFSPPWTVWLFLPLASLEAHWAMAGFTLVSMAMVAVVSYLYAQESGSVRPWLVTLLVAFCPYTLVMLFTGTPDPWSLLGIFLSFRAVRTHNPGLLGAGLVLAAVRPQNAVLVVPALLLAVLRWPRRELARMAAAPGAVLLLSFLGFGWDWPLRWWQSYRVLPPSPRWFTSIYTGVELLGLPVWSLAPAGLALAVAVLLQVRRSGLTRFGFEAALAADAVIIPYIRSVSFVVLLAVSWAGLAARRPRMAAAAYAISLPTLAVPLFWERLAVVDLTFPIALLGLLWLDTRLPPRAEARDDVV